MSPKVLKSKAKAAGMSTRDFKAMHAADPFANGGIVTGKELSASAKSNFRQQGRGRNRRPGD